MPSLLGPEPKGSAKKRTAAIAPQISGKKVQEQGTYKEHRQLLQIGDSSSYSTAAGTGEARDDSRYG
jgi:hypothetical protein